MDVGLIFDLDGTLLDSTFIIGRVMNEIHLSLGYPHLEFDVYNQLIGLPPNLFILHKHMRRPPMANATEFF
jgi:beta-phosphoglucomutase-like phosphatase (HAD superfamily)